MSSRSEKLKAPIIIEEIKEKKKAGIIRRILKWVGLSVLSLLLILAIVFQAPWKVITLLAIIFLACTILPRQFRKWFWLSAAAIVVILIIWIFLPDDNEGWRPYTFDEELAALQAKYTIPDEENAAIIYNELLETCDYNDFAYSTLDNNVYNSIYSGTWSKKDYPEAAAWLQRIQSKIKILIEASKIENCRFPISNPSNREPQGNRNSAMRRWASVLVIAENNDIAESHFNEALEKNVALLRMAKHLYQQPTFMDLLVAMSFESIALHKFNKFVITTDATEPHLIVIEKALADAKHDWNSLWRRNLAYEKICTKDELANYYEINAKGRIRLSRDPLKEMRARIRKFLENEEKDEEIDDDKLKDIFEQVRNIQKRTAYPSYLQKKRIKAYTIIYWFYMPSNPQKAASFIDAYYQKCYTMEDSDWQLQEESAETSLTAALFHYLRYLTEYWVYVPNTSLSKMHYLYLRLSSDLRGSKIIIALRRYKNKTGHWPESLDEIKTLTDPNVFIDPINGGNFVYKLTEENFTLYRKGTNNIDEGGKRDRWDEEKTGADDWLIWPLKLPKTDEEKADVESD